MPRAITLRTCQRRLKVDSEKLFELRSETTLPRACAMHGVVVVEKETNSFVRIVLLSKPHPEAPSMLIWDTGKEPSPVRSALAEF